MKVIEKYLTMTEDKQLEDFSKHDYFSSMGVIQYLNSEIDQDPLEKLGWVKDEDGWGYRKGYGVNKKYDIRLCIADKSVGSWYLNSDGTTQSHANYIKADELKAILKIMEGMK